MLSFLDFALIEALRELPPVEFDEVLASEILPVAGLPEQRQEVRARVEYLRRYIKATSWDR